MLAWCSGSCSLECRSTGTGTVNPAEIKRRRQRTAHDIPAYASLLRLYSLGQGKLLGTLQFGEQWSAKLAAERPTCSTRRVGDFHTRQLRLSAITRALGAV